MARGLPSSWFLDVSIDAKGQAHGASLRDGVVRIDRKGRVQRPASHQDEWALFVDASGEETRVGSQSGARRLASGKSAGLPSLHPNVHSIACWQDKLAIASEAGVVILESGAKP